MFGLSLAPLAPSMSFRDGVGTPVELVSRRGAVSAAGLSPVTLRGVESDVTSESQRWRAGRAGWRRRYAVESSDWVRFYEVLADPDDMDAPLWCSCRAGVFRAGEIVPCVHTAMVALHLGLDLADA